MNQIENKSNARPAIVEMMGHRRFGALVEETTFMGSMALRVVALTDPPFEQVITNPAAIFALTYCSEEQARQASTRTQWGGAYVPEEFRRLLPPPAEARPVRPVEEDAEAEAEIVEDDDEDCDFDAYAEELLPNRRSEGDTGEYEESPSEPCDVCGASADEECKPDCFAEEICDHGLRIEGEGCSDCDDESCHACRWEIPLPLPPLGVTVCRGCGNVHDATGVLTHDQRNALSEKVMAETIARQERERAERIAAEKERRAKLCRVCEGGAETNALCQRCAEATCEHGKRVVAGERCVECEPKCEHGKPLVLRGGDDWCAHGCNCPF